MLTFCADVLFIFQRFQKKLQSDSLTLPMFCCHVQGVIDLLNGFKVEPIKGGFESNLMENVTHQEGVPYWSGVELMKSRERRNNIPFDIRQFKDEVVSLLVEFLKVRLQDEDKQLLSTIDSFLKFDNSCDIAKVHELIAKDLCLLELNVQYSDLCNSVDGIKKQSLSELLKYLSSISRAEYFREISIVVARILACTPHSADVERTISANNNLKTHKRNCFQISTENDYLYAHFNMPPLEKFDVRSAVKKWMCETNRRQASCTISSTKSINRKYFKNIFGKVEEEKEVENETDVDTSM